MLITLYPALLDFAEAELRRQGMSENLAEDIAQDAARRYSEVCSTEAGARSFMRNFIRRQIHNLNREGADVMTRHPLSLEELSE